MTDMGSMSHAFTKDRPSCAIFGGGPAGLTAGYKLIQSGCETTVYESSEHLGGISRTEEYRGYRFDIGGHRFYSKVSCIEEMWKDVLGDQLLERPRLSRIYYDNKFFDYPLSVSNVIRNLGICQTLLAGGSYAHALLFPRRTEVSFEDWVINRFGHRLYQTFFKSYTEKVWGIPCSEIRADWAAQRIKGLSFVSALRNAILRTDGVKSLIGKFYYPRLGPGQMWERCGEVVEAKGGHIDRETRLERLQHDGEFVRSASIRRRDSVEEIVADHYVSSIPLSTLVQCMVPKAPEDVLAAARGLNYRDFLIVVLLVNKQNLFPDNWLYIHSPEVRVGRIQNFKNWSPSMVPDDSTTSIGMEYFCSEGDDLWRKDSDDLISIASQELQTIGLGVKGDVFDGCIIRQRKAYPVYDSEYRSHVETIRRYVAQFKNLQTIGRNGMHRYNNQDHSMLCGMLAAQNILGANHDLWEINTERSYYEEQVVQDSVKIEATS